jgi:hypothetical protein
MTIAEKKRLGKRPRGKRTNFLVRLAQKRQFDGLNALLFGSFRI